MQDEITMGILISIVVASTQGIMRWVRCVLMFKIDENTILSFLKESKGEYKFRSTEAISASTNLKTTRVSAVCAGSRLIKRNTKVKESWRLK